MAGREVDLGDQAVSINQRLFWCEVFGVGQIVSFIDSFGDESDDDDDAVMAIVRIDEGCWLRRGIKRLRARWRRALAGARSSMAAAIILETGAGVDGGNCYFTIAELRAYYEGHQHSTAVDAVEEDDDLIPAAIQACRMVDISTKLRGVKKIWDQDMEWPRFGVRIDVDPAAAVEVGAVVLTGGENVLATGAGAIPANVVPKNYKRACMEMVRFVLAKDRDAEFDKPQVKRVKLDAIEREYASGSGIDLIPEIVQRMVEPFVLAQADAGGPNGAGGNTARAVQLMRG
jgi:hypothetical protein